MIENLFQAGERLFIAGASGEPRSVSATIFGGEDLNILTSFVPGVNALSLDMVGVGTCVSNLFMSTQMAEAQREGRFRHLPFSYAGMAKYIAEGPELDTAIVQISPPNDAGYCSLGAAAEFMPIALKRAVRKIGVINEAAPFARNAPMVKLSDCAHIVETDAALATYDAGAIDDATRRIANSVSAYIDDGCAFQVGLGKVPHALMDALHDRQNLRIHSGMVSDGVLDLAQSGALDPNWEHATTVALGTKQLYDWLADGADIHIRGVDFTHSQQILSGIDRLIAVNSALEVDLLGQCNLEFANGRAVSGSGGATDFARAARLSVGGLSIVALPATFGNGKGSRIVAHLGGDAITSLARTEVDIVVTEQGAADLRGKSVHERAEAMIEIAAPIFRSDLVVAWQDMRRKL